MKRRYVLVAGGTHRPFRATFGDEEQARRAFVDRRLKSARAEAWARLTAVDASGDTQVLGWFGPAGDVPEEDVPAGRRRRAPGIVAAAAAVVVAGAWLIADQDRPPAARTPAARDPGAPVPGGHEVIRTEQLAYAPGTSRSWEPTEGLHQVTVVAGTLSVEAGQGDRQEYGAGESYGAGWSPYATANRTDQPVTVIVRYLGERGR